MALKTAKASLNAAQRVRPNPAQQDDLRSIALDLAPLVAKYRSQGRLSLRVEHMQQHARLSRGRNNGDRSWSLMSDELDRLEYLVRGETLEAHSLSVRVVDIERDGSTLAVLEVPVPLDGSPASAAPGDRTPSISIHETTGLKDELEKLKAEIAARDGELARGAAELAAAQEQTRTQLQEQLAAANALAAQILEEKQKRWQSERDALVAKNERTVEQALAEARAKWERETSEARLTVADTKSEFQKKLQQIENTAAEASARAEKAEAALTAAKALRTAEDTVQADKQRILQDGLSKALADMSARAGKSEDTLARANANAEQTERILRAEIDALKGVAAKSEIEEAARLSAAEKAWAEKADGIVAELKERATRAKADGANALLEATSNAATTEKKLRDELSGTMENLRNREAALADAHAQIAKYAQDASEHDRTRAELTAARAALAEQPSPPPGNAVTGPAVAEIEQRVRQEAAEALNKAKTEWAKTEAAKISEVEARIQVRAETAIREAKARAHKSEEALTKLRKDLADRVPGRSSSSEIAELQERIIALQASLAGRESELARLNEVVRENDLYRTGRKTAETEDNEESSKKTIKLVRDIALVIVLVAVPIVLFPYVEPMLPYKWQYQIETAIPMLSSGPAAQSDRQSAPETAQKPTAKPVTAERGPEAIATRTARLHAEPKTSSRTLSIVPAGTGVSPIRKSGNWTMVRAGSVQGWIYDTYLKDVPRTKSRD